MLKQIKMAQSMNSSLPSNFQTKLQTKKSILPLQILLLLSLMLSLSLQSNFSIAQNLLDKNASSTMPPQVPPLNNNENTITIEPFGSNLFSGNFLKSREDGLNPNYIVMPGDRVAVYTWGSIQINEVFVVDGQGNIFISEIGPIHLEGVKNADLTKTVKAKIKKVYSYGFNVYTNLITANPVAVFVTGAIKNPGRYAGIPSDSILFFLNQAGGIDANWGSYRKIVVIRDGEQFAEIDLYDFILKGKMQTIQFQDGDTVLVSRRGPIIEMNGNVADSAVVEFKDDNITGANALEIVPHSATATAVTIVGLRHNMPFNKTLTISQFQHETLLDGDIVTLRKEGRSDTIIVKFEGEFDGPSMLSVKRGSRLLDVLNYVPTNPNFANINAVHIRRKSVAKAQKDAIADSLFRLERSALLALAQSQGEAAIRVKEAELTAEFVKRARLIDPLGRVVTAQNGKQLNVVLENDDVIVIPTKTNVVKVGGEVMISQAVMHSPDMKARDYISMAGGYSNRADKGLVIVLHANASISVENTRFVIQPGDEILIPPRITIKGLQNAMDVMQIIYQVAMSAAVIIAL